MTRRGQSSPLAVVLLIGIVLTGATTVAVLGGGFIDGVSSSAETERAGQEMTQLASEAAAVALGGSQQRGMSVDASQGRLSVENDASWICVENGTTANRSFILPEGADDNKSCGGARKNMGTVRYDTGDATVAYEGGGVWRRGDDGRARMVSPPEFHYRGDTLTLPVVVVSGDIDSGGSRIDLTATAGPTDRADTLTNPLPDSGGSVYVTIHSEYYEAWGNFIFERTAGRVVELDHDDETVTVELVVPEPSEIQHAAYATGQQSDAIQIDGGACVDSYNSTTGPYDGSSHPNVSCDVDDENATVATHGGMSSVKAEVSGDLYTVRSGGHIGIADSANITGDVHSQQSLTIDDEAYVGGTVYANQSVTLQAGGSLQESVHAYGTADIMGNGVIEGDVYTTHRAITGDDARIVGDIHADNDVQLSDGAVVSGTVRTGEYVNLADDVVIESDVYAEHNNPIRCGDNAIIEGDAYVPNPGQVDDGCVNGTVNPQSDANVQSPEDLDEPVIDPPEIEDPPENETDSIPTACEDGEDSMKVSDGQTCELTDGTYDLEKIDVQGGGTLELNYSDGRVELYLDELVTNQGGEIVTTPDNNKAKWVEVNIRDQGSVEINDDLTAVVNAPDGHVELGDGAELYGAVIANSVKMNDGSRLHYDEALSGRTVGDGQNGTTSVQYLHVTTNEIEIED